MRWMKKIALLLIAVMLLGMLAGCDLSKLGLSGKRTIMLDGTVNCYEEPDLNSKLLTSISGGLMVEYSEAVSVEGIDWIKTEHGWAMLSQPAAKAETTISTEMTIPVETEAIQWVEAFVTSQLRMRSGPGTDYDTLFQLSAGTQIFIGKTSYASDGLWGQTEDGWVPMNSVYYPGDMGKNPGYAVVREQGAKVRDVVLNYSTTLATLEVGQGVDILEQLWTEDGTHWVYGVGGWIRGDEVYIEGTAGKRTCTGYINDPTGTPLNIRSGPGTDFEKRGKLTNGTYVEVLEQIKRKNKDWGYVEVNGVRGWIFMDYVDRGY